MQQQGAEVIQARQQPRQAAGALCQQGPLALRAVRAPQGALP